MNDDACPTSSGGKPLLFLGCHYVTLVQPFIASFVGFLAELCGKCGQLDEHRGKPLLFLGCIIQPLCHTRTPSSYNLRYQSDGNGGGVWGVFVDKYCTVNNPQYMYIILVLHLYVLGLGLARIHRATDAFVSFDIQLSHTHTHTHHPPHTDPTHSCLVIN